MTGSPVVKRQHGGHTGTNVPTGYWEGPRPAPYGNFPLGICEGAENCDYWKNFYQQHNSHILGMYVSVSPVIPDLDLVLIVCCCCCVRYITWGFIAAMVLVTGAINFSSRHQRRQRQDSGAVGDEEGKMKAGAHSRVRGALAAFFRRRFLPQSLYGLFPRVTRLQATMALLLTLYCLIFTFAGISYGAWVNPTTPPGRRIGFLEFSGDRTGCLAFAFVPLVFILSSRDNIFSLITGISYQHFNFLHRLVGWFIFIMTWVHTILWSVEEAIMYQPQPAKYISTWNKRFWKYGVGATALLTFLFLHSFRIVRVWTGYEFFRKSHEFIAVLFLGACWGHWPLMRECE